MLSHHLRVLNNLLPSLVGVRPLIMLAGFLGAGETTFLRRCLAAKRCARQMIWAIGFSLIIAWAGAVVF